MSAEWGLWAVIALVIPALLAAAVVLILRHRARRRNKGRPTFLWYR